MRCVRVRAELQERNDLLVQGRRDTRGGPRLLRDTRNERMGRRSPQRLYAP